MQHVPKCWKCNLTAQNTRKPFGGWGSAPDPAVGAYRAPSNPLVGGDGLAVPSPRTHPPALGPSGLASPHSKISSDAVDFVASETTTKKALKIVDNFFSC